MKYILSLAALAAAASAQTVPTFPKIYSVSGTIVLPYDDIYEPFVSWVDAVNNRQRTEYWNGLDTYITRGDIANSWQVNPVVTTMECFANPGPVNITGFLPDTTVAGWKFTGTNIKEGVLCNTYTYIVNQLQKVNTYNLYVDAATNTIPILYEFVAYDTLLGSHYDQYLFKYDKYIAPASNWDPSIFEQPPYQCGPFPSSTFETADERKAQADAALEMVRGMIYPQPAWAGSVNYGPGMKDPAFAKFMNTFGKMYSNEQEATQRYATFIRNHRRIIAANRKARTENRSLRLEMNFLGDAYEAELSLRKGKNREGVKKASVSLMPLKGAEKTHVAPKDVSSLPTSINWIDLGAVNKPADQAICGSCWAHGSVEMLEGQYFIKSGKLEVLSKQQVMDCSWGFGNNACDGGEDFLGYEYIMAAGGLATKANYGPYMMADGLCHDNKTEKALAITGYTNVTSGDIDALADALANHGPVSISIDADVYSFTFYSSGIYDDPLCKADPADIDHTVLAVGYGVQNGVNYWIVQNSWSTHWGNNGLILVQKDQQNICGVATMPTYADIQVL